MEKNSESFELAYYGFISSLNEEQFDFWYQHITQEEAEYAHQLLINIRAQATEMVAEKHDEVEDLSGAENVLSKFTLKGKV